jgi:D-alanyl-D-alanine carboxypeptidase/D-alanyl-D-alanine-endopeptidase (penicillin-binding protein 4)
MGQMKRPIAALIITLCLIQQAVAASIPKVVRDELRRANIPLSSVGIVVQKVDTNTALTSRNAERAMNPASTMKLLTTFAALEILGPAYRWKTEAYLDGKLENGVLHGDLVFKGYGDPKLTVEQFWMWLRELRLRGLREIRGDVVLDRSFFEDIDHDPAEFDNDPTRAYNVGPNALLLNFNALHLRLIPNATSTDALLEPDLSGYMLNNRVKTVARRPCSGGDNYTAHLEEHSIVLEGTIPVDCGEVDDYFSLLPHGDYFFAVFSALWKEMGGTLQGGMREGRAPADHEAFSTHFSAPLSEVIRDINKYSNNIMARQVFLTLGTAVPESTHTVEANHAQDLMQEEDVIALIDDPGELPSPEGSQPLQTANGTQPDGLPSNDLAVAQLPTPVKVRTNEANPFPAEGWTESPPDAGPSGDPGIAIVPPAASPGSAPVGAPTLRVEPPAASIPRSIVAMRLWLKSEHMDFPELVLENGAGLSRKERISPQHLAELLRHASHSRYAAEFEASLPILGMDGTMTKRFKDNEIAGYAHIKTGMLQGVKSIAGYVNTHSGNQWTVVFLVNHRNASLSQPAQDALIEWLQKWH